MKIFSYLYNKTIDWSGHPHAPYYLAGISFAESSFFPIPPDVMLISMGLATPNHSWRYALITTTFSVLGGLFGYLLGFYFMQLFLPYILSSSYADSYNLVKTWFTEGGVWMVILAGFTPFPYKIFTITAGAMHMALFPFLIGSLIGRGLRFFLVSGILFFAGDKIHNRLRIYMDIIGWSALVLVIVAIVLFKWVF
ncbi:SNARE associated Golgi protein (plasmid) [Legionella adelaidensis]|uniref:Putative membrane protein n=1 Tax=Legionella adelaidensis TaxID=45056 RepID=A0A0W0R285_9GAMM|nr:VTT domain-containing protein [Legionella adelaidensis]KTC65175.1 putative membrane protein [Legionella adelaidensis]VEH85069.1 SNARE associated Golgi protein [Legionella adelaidensis]